MSKLHDETLDQLVKLRHQIHRHAELSGNEEQTAKRIVSFLEPTNPDDIITGVGGHGVMVVYRGQQEGPRVMVRCELDALPIPEENVMEYRSENEGVSHKCGHDGHMAMVAGLGSILKKQPPVRGEVVLLFQPAEETGAGACRVLEDEKFRSMKPDYIFALHNLPGYPMGQVVLRDEIFAAASVGLKVRLTGETSHAASPEKGRSPAPAVAQLIESLSAIPQYATSIDRAAKVTVIHVRLGEEAFGTSPGQAVVMATLRTYRDEALETIKEKAIQYAEGIAATYDLQLETEWVEPFRATNNDSECVRVVNHAAERAGMEIYRKPTPFGWSEDFGYFTADFDGALCGLGSGTGQPQLHAGNYDFPDALIPTGVTLFTHIIEQLTGGDETDN